MEDKESWAKFMSADLDADAVVIKDPFAAFRAPEWDVQVGRMEKKGGFPLIEPALQSGVACLWKVHYPANNRVCRIGIVPLIHQMATKS